MGRRTKLSPSRGIRRPTARKDFNVIEELFLLNFFSNKCLALRTLMTLPTKKMLVTITMMPGTARKKILFSNPIQHNSFSNMCRYDTYGRITSAGPSHPRNMSAVTQEPSFMNVLTKIIWR